MNQYRNVLVLLSVVSGVLPDATAAPVIGTASTRGQMEVDKVAVRGTANIKAGSQVRTAETASQIRLRNGNEATFETKTAAVVFGNRIQLNEGSSQFTTRHGFEVNALGLRFSPTGRTAVTRVAYEGSKRLAVTPVEASVDVHRGLALVAKLDAGKTYYFDEDDQGGGAAVPAGAGKAAGGAAASGGKAAAVGLSTGAKIGIGVGVAAAATGAGVGIALAGDDASR